jgi:hypothetical protein
MKRATAALIARWNHRGRVRALEDRAARKDSSAPSPARPVFRKNSSSVSRKIAGACASASARDRSSFEAASRA